MNGDAQLFKEALWPPETAAPTRTVRCRHCRTRNRVEVPTAAITPEHHRCGACHKALFLGPDEPLTGIAPLAYEHSLDRRSLSALKAVPALPQLIRALLVHVGDRTARIQCMSDSILCSEEQFPELLHLLDKVRQRLDIEMRPALFLGESPHMNAMTTGVAEPIIVVRSGLLNQMEKGELAAILGHELGHLHSGHPLYHTAAMLLLQGSSALSPFVRILASPLHRLLLGWSRCAELTADRAALLASRSLGDCLNAMLILAGGRRPGTSEGADIRLAPFIAQCRELALMHHVDSFDAAVGRYLMVDRTHPHIAWRVLHLIRWVEHGNYLNILSGDYLRRETSDPERLGTRESHAIAEEASPAEQSPVSNEGAA
jgi:hypothetical protein